MKNRIFYFTATGNSLQVSNDLAEMLGDCEVVSIAGFDRAEPITAERIGIVFPVYFWGLPLIVERFLNEMKIEGNPYLFAVATFGLWPGKALELAEGVLRRRGMQMNTGFFIKMPDNYILWYGAKSQAAQTKCFQNEKEKIKKISRVFLSKANTPIEKSRYGIDRLLTVPVNRLSVKKFSATSSKFSVNNDCIGCGRCAGICPVQNIRLENGKPKWENQCEACLACIQRCPKLAINYNHKTERRKRYVNPYVKF